MKPEILSRLTPGSVSLEPTSRATGDRLTAADIAAAMAGCSEHQMWLAECKYIGHMPAALKLIRHIEGVVKYSARVEWWKIKEGSNLLSHIAECAVWEYVDPGRCPQCHGVALLDENCGICRGSGNIRYTDKLRAGALGLNINTYRARWKRRYLAIIERLGVIDQGIIDILKKQE